MRNLGLVLLVTGFVWACLSVPMYRAFVTATTSDSLHVTEGKEHLSREEVFSALVRNDSEMKRYSWRIVLPALVTFVGGVLLAGSRDKRRGSKAAE
jgi:hypothetical protein